MFHYISVSALNITNDGSEVSRFAQQINKKMEYKLIDVISYI